VRKGIEKTIVLVLDSLGIGDLPDSHFHNSRNCNTLSHINEKADSLHIPNLAKLGIGNLVYLNGSYRTSDTIGFYGKMGSLSASKDSVSGHWELMGVKSSKEFINYSSGIPEEILSKLLIKTGNDFIGNKNLKPEAALLKFGDLHKKTKKPIIITSDDSIIYIATHEEIIPKDELYTICKKTLKNCEEYNLARVCALPFTGTSKNYSISDKKRVFCTAPPYSSILELLINTEIPVHTVGKISDIFSQKGITSSKSGENNEEAIENTLEIMAKGIRDEFNQSFIFANLPDFDSVYAHNKDIQGYANALEEFDRNFPKIMRSMGERDILIITADHGNDPTSSEPGHTREYVPLLVYSALLKPKGYGNLGVRKTMSDVAKTIADIYDIETTFTADSFWDNLIVLL